MEQAQNPRRSGADSTLVSPAVANRLESLGDLLDAHQVRRAPAGIEINSAVAPEVDVGNHEVSSIGACRPLRPRRAREAAPDSIPVGIERIVKNSSSTMGVSRRLSLAALDYLIIDQENPANPDRLDYRKRALCLSRAELAAHSEVWGSIEHLPNTLVEWNACRYKIQIRWFKETPTDTAYQVEIIVPNIFGDPSPGTERVPYWIPAAALLDGEDDTAAASNDTAEADTWRKPTPMPLLLAIIKKLEIDLRDDVEGTKATALMDSVYAQMRQRAERYGLQQGQPQSLWETAIEGLLSDNPNLSPVVARVGEGAPAPKWNETIKQLELIDSWRTSTKITVEDTNEAGVRAPLKLPASTYDHRDELDEYTVSIELMTCPMMAKAHWTLDARRATNETEGDAVLTTPLDDRMRRCIYSLGSIGDHSVALDPIEQPVSLDSQYENDSADTQLLIEVVGSCMHLMTLLNSFAMWYAVNVDHVQGEKVIRETINHCRNSLSDTLSRGFQAAVALESTPVAGEEEAGPIMAVNNPAWYLATRIRMMQNAARSIATLLSRTNTVDKNGLRAAVLPFRSAASEFANVFVGTPIFGPVDRIAHLCEAHLNFDMTTVMFAARQAENIIARYPPGGVDSSATAPPELDQLTISEHNHGHGVRAVRSHNARVAAVIQGASDEATGAVIAAQTNMGRGQVRPIDSVAEVQREFAIAITGTRRSIAAHQPPNFEQLNEHANACHAACQTAVILLEQNAFVLVDDDVDVAAEQSRMREARDLVVRAMERVNRLQEGFGSMVEMLDTLDIASGDVGLAYRVLHPGPPEEPVADVIANAGEGDAEAHAAVRAGLDPEGGTALPPDVHDAERADMDPERTGIVIEAVIAAALAVYEEDPTEFTWVAFETVVRSSDIADRIALCPEDENFLACVLRVVELVNVQVPGVYRALVENRRLVARTLTNRLMVRADYAEQPDPAHRQATQGMLSLGHTIKVAALAAALFVVGGRTTQYYPETQMATLVDDMRCYPWNATHFRDFNHSMTSTGMLYEQQLVYDGGITLQSNNTRWPVQPETLIRRGLRAADEQRARGYRQQFFLPPPGPELTPWPMPNPDAPTFSLWAHRAMVRNRAEFYVVGGFSTEIQRSGLEMVTTSGQRPADAEFLVLRARYSYSPETSRDNQTLADGAMHSAIRRIQGIPCEPETNSDDPIFFQPTTEQVAAAFEWGLVPVGRGWDGNPYTGSDLIVVDRETAQEHLGMVVFNQSAYFNNASTVVGRMLSNSEIRETRVVEDDGCPCAWPADVSQPGLSFLTSERGPANPRTVIRRIGDAILGAGAATLGVGSLLLMELTIQVDSSLADSPALGGIEVGQNANENEEDADVALTVNLAALRLPRIDPPPPPPSPIENDASRARSAFKHCVVRAVKASTIARERLQQRISGMSDIGFTAHMPGDVSVTYEAESRYLCPCGSIELWRMLQHEGQSTSDVSAAMLGVLEMGEFDEPPAETYSSSDKVYSATLASVEVSDPIDGFEVDGSSDKSSSFEDIGADGVPAAARKDNEDVFFGGGTPGIELPTSLRWAAGGAAVLETMGLLGTAFTLSTVGGQQGTTSPMTYALVATAFRRFVAYGVAFSGIRWVQGELPGYGREANREDWALSGLARLPNNPDQDPAPNVPPGDDIYAPFISAGQYPGKTLLEARLVARATRNYVAMVATNTSSLLYMAWTVQRAVETVGVPTWGQAGQPSSIFGDPRDFTNRLVVSTLVVGAASDIIAGYASIKSESRRQWLTPYIWNVALTTLAVTQAYALNPLFLKDPVFMNTPERERGVETLQCMGYGGLLIQHTALYFGAGVAMKRYGWAGMKMLLGSMVKSIGAGSLFAPVVTAADFVSPATRIAGLIATAAMAYSNSGLLNAIGVQIADERVAQVTQIGGSAVAELLLPAVSAHYLSVFLSYVSTELVGQALRLRTYPGEAGVAFPQRRLDPRGLPIPQLNQAQSQAVLIQRYIKMTAALTTGAALMGFAHNVTLSTNITAAVSSVVLPAINIVTSAPSVLIFRALRGAPVISALALRSESSFAIATFFGVQLSWWATVEHRLALTEFCTRYLPIGNPRNAMRRYGPMALGVMQVAAATGAIAYEATNTEARYNQAWAQTLVTESAAVACMGAWACDARDFVWQAFNPRVQRGNATIAPIPVTPEPDDSFNAAPTAANAARLRRARYVTAISATGLFLGFVYNQVSSYFETGDDDRKYASFNEMLNNTNAAFGIEGRAYARQSRAVLEYLLSSTATDQPVIGLALEPSLQRAKTPKATMDFPVPANIDALIDAIEKYQVERQSAILGFAVFDSDRFELLREKSLGVAKARRAVSPSPTYTEVLAHGVIERAIDATERRIANLQKADPMDAPLPNTYTATLAGLAAGAASNIGTSLAASPAVAGSDLKEAHIMLSARTSRALDDLNDAVRGPQLGSYCSPNTTLFDPSLRVPDNHKLSWEINPELVPLDNLDTANEITPATAITALAKLGFALIQSGEKHHLINMIAKNIRYSNAPCEITTGGIASDDRTVVELTKAMVKECTWRITLTSLVAFDDNITSIDQAYDDATAWLGGRIVASQLLKETLKAIPSDAAAAIRSTSEDTKAKLLRAHRDIAKLVYAGPVLPYNRLLPAQVARIKLDILSNAGQATRLSMPVTQAVELLAVSALRRHAGMAGVDDYVKWNNVKSIIDRINGTGVEAMTRDAVTVRLNDLERVLGDVLTIASGFYNPGHERFPMLSRRDNEHLGDNKRYVFVERAHTTYNYDQAHPRVNFAHAVFELVAAGCATGASSRIESIHIYRSRSGDADPGGASIHFKEYGYVQHVNSFEDAIGKLVEYFTTAEGAPLAGRLAVCVHMRPIRNLYKSVPVDVSAPKSLQSLTTSFLRRTSIAGFGADTPPDYLRSFNRMMHRLVESGSASQEWNDTKTSTAYANAFSMLAAAEFARDGQRDSGDGSGVCLVSDQPLTQPVAMRYARALSEGEGRFGSVSSSTRDSLGLGFLDTYNGDTNTSEYATASLATPRVGEAWGSVALFEGSAMRQATTALYSALVASALQRQQTFDDLPSAPDTTQKGEINKSDELLRLMLTQASAQRGDVDTEYTRAITSIMTASGSPGAETLGSATKTNSFVAKFLGYRGASDASEAISWGEVLTDLLGRACIAAGIPDTPGLRREIAVVASACAVVYATEGFGGPAGAKACYEIIAVAFATRMVPGLLDWVMQNALPSAYEKVDTYVNSRLVRRLGRNAKNAKGMVILCNTGQLVLEVGVGLILGIAFNPALFSGVMMHWPNMTEMSSGMVPKESIHSTILAQSYRSPAVLALPENYALSAISASGSSATEVAMSLAYGIAYASIYEARTGGLALLGFGMASLTPPDTPAYLTGALYNLTSVNATKLVTAISPTNKKVSTGDAVRALIFKLDNVKKYEVYPSYYPRLEALFDQAKQLQASNSTRFTSSGEIIDEITMSAIATQLGGTPQFGSEERQVDTIATVVYLLCNNTRLNGTDAERWFADSMLESLGFPSSHQIRNWVRDPSKASTFADDAAGLDSDYYTHLIKRLRELPRTQLFDDVMQFSRVKTNEPLNITNEYVVSPPEYAFTLPFIGYGLYHAYNWRWWRRSMRRNVFAGSAWYTVPSYESFWMVGMGIGWAMASLTATAADPVAAAVYGWYGGATSLDNLTGRNVAALWLLRVPQYGLVLMQRHAANKMDAGALIWPLVSMPRTGTRIRQGAVVADPTRGAGDANAGWLSRATRVGREETKASTVLILHAAEMAALLGIAEMRECYDDAKLPFLTSEAEMIDEYKAVGVPLERLNVDHQTQYATIMRRLAKMRVVEENTGAVPRVKNDRQRFEPIRYEHTPGALGAYAALFGAKEGRPVVPLGHAKMEGTSANVSDALRRSVSGGDRRWSLRAAGWQAAVFALRNKTPRMEDHALATTARMISTGFLNAHLAEFAVIVRKIVNAGTTANVEHMMEPLKRFVGSKAVPPMALEIRRKGLVELGFMAMIYDDVVVDQMPTGYTGKRSEYRTAAHHGLTERALREMGLNRVGVTPPAGSVSLQTQARRIMMLNRIEEFGNKLVEDVVCVPLRKDFSCHSIDDVLMGDVTAYNEFVKQLRGAVIRTRALRAAQTAVEVDAMLAEGMVPVLHMSRSVLVPESVTDVAWRGEKDLSENATLGVSP